MTSKNSYWISMLENLKRRLWPIAIFCMTFVFAYPVKIAMILSRQASYNTSLMNLKKDAVTYMGFDAVTALLLTIGAVFSAIQGFSYLYSRKKTDMYVSQPVTARKRFGVIYLNGILVYFIPYMIAQLLSLVVAASFHATSSILAANILFSMVASLIYFLVIYNIAILAVMLTGHLVVTVLATGVFLGYEIFLRSAVLESYCSAFFKSYANMEGMTGIKYFFAPVMKAYQLAGTTQNVWDIEVLNMSGAWENLMKPMLPTMGVLLLQAVVVAIVAYVCYSKRPLEACGKAMAFERTKAPVKIFLIVAAGLTGGIWFYSLSEQAIGFAVLGLLSGLLVGQFVVEIIYEFDLKALLKHRISFAVSAGIAVLIFLIYVLDITGYDRYIPQPEQIRYAAIKVDFNNNYMYDYIDEKYQGAWNYNYNFDHMQLTDTAAVLAMAKDGMGTDLTDVNYRDYYYATVCYKLKNGRMVYRCFPIFMDQEEENLNALFATKGYKEGSAQITEAFMHDFYQICKANYSDGMNSIAVTAANAGDLMAAYQQDYLAMTYDDIKDAVPCGIITLNNNKKGYRNSLSYPVFPSYKNTCQYLQDKGITLTLQIDPKAIESITVVNNNVDLTEDAADTGTVESTAEKAMAVSVINGKEVWSDYPQAVYKDQAKISKIVQNVVLTELTSWAYNPNVTENYLSVDVTAANNEAGYGYNWYYTGVAFLKGQVPDFVQLDVAYSAE